jgi:peroxiredoxin
MARANGFILDTGTPFPDLEFPALDGQRIVLPRDFEGRWAVLLFYRGHW